MQITPNSIIGIALLLFALALVPDKYRPQWIYRLTWWQMLIGLIAIVAAAVIVATPEFYALGILGDSTFFDLLVLAIGIQLQVVLWRVGFRVFAGAKWAVRLLGWRFHAACIVLALALDEIVSVGQKVAHRFFS